jgi:hypothetical protein
MADTEGASPAGGMATPADVAAQLRSPAYARLLVLAAILGAPISAAAYFFLHLVNLLQDWVYADLPRALGFAAVPLWWPLPMLGIAGVLVGLAIQHLPGNGGHWPVDGFSPGLCRRRSSCRVSCWRRSRAWGWGSCSGRRRR